MFEGLLGPGRVLDDPDEVRAGVALFGAVQDVGLHIAEGGLGSVGQAGVEGVEGAALEVGARLGGDDGLAGFRGKRVVADAEDVELDAGCDERHFGGRVVRNFRCGVRGDALPDQMGAVGAMPWAVRKARASSAPPRSKRCWGRYGTAR
ncbi:hypothetical protein [Streptomyces decoyicus]